MEATYTQAQPESQNNEWKASWHDEYFKWLCGYANVGGGHLFVGVNDDGFVVGLKNYRRLLEELPNQIKTKMGIIALSQRRAPRSQHTLQHRRHKRVQQEDPGRDKRQRQKLVRCRYL